MAHAVNVEIRDKIVRIVEKMMTMPTQNRKVPCASVIKACRISVVTPEELKRTPSSVLRSKDMNTMELEYRLDV